jgi:hypothetical protein
MNAHDVVPINLPVAQTDIEKRADVMKNSHSRGSAKEQGPAKITSPGKQHALILRLRESGQNLADSMGFFSMSAIARRQ